MSGLRPEGLKLTSGGQGLHRVFVSRVSIVLFGLRGVEFGSCSVRDSTCILS